MNTKTPAHDTKKSESTSSAPVAAHDAKAHDAKAHDAKAHDAKAQPSHDEKHNAMKAKDLTKVAPHSPRERVDGFAIATRAVDKCLASIAGTAGEYHFDCPLDNMLFTFKGITGEQFKKAAQASKSYAEVGTWLEKNGTAKTPAEIKAWSDEMDAFSPMRNPEKKAGFIENCARLGLNAETNTTFDMLEADDRATFRAKPHATALAV